MVASTLQQPTRGWFDVLDDWILNATALSLWDLVWTTSFSHCLSCNWMDSITGTTFVTSWYTHGLASSYLEGANFLTADVSTPADAMGHSLLLLWGPEGSGRFRPLVPTWGTLGIFVALHGTLRSYRFYASTI